MYLIALAVSRVARHSTWRHDDDDDDDDADADDNDLEVMW